MQAAKDAGLSVFRTWGFNDKNVTYIEDGLPQYGGEGAGGTEVVYQWWDNGVATIDVTPFDKVVDAALQTGIKLIVALTNNWADYGGMDVYTVNLGGKYHDDVSPSLPHTTTRQALPAYLVPSSACLGIFY
jgi:mannan endo-1,4-beta-mannosidase